MMLLPLILIMAACGGKQMKNTNPDVSPISALTTQQAVSELIDKHGEPHRFRIERGVSQAAQLWRSTDGSENEFKIFCLESFVADAQELDVMFNKLSGYFEILGGGMLKMKKDLMRALHLDVGPIHPLDVRFGSYEPGAHLKDDFFANKVGFIVALNFPFYSLNEKSALGQNWSRKEWAYARMGDYYTSRVPASIIQQASAIETESDNYIAEYNIYMGKLVNDAGEKLFPENLRLITHWGLRDELKSNYADERGLEKQRLVYAVMKRIIDQSIPQDVVNKSSYNWNPVTNQLTNDGTPVEFKPEPDTRYQMLLNNFNAQRSLDPYYPMFPTYIKRQFEANMEIPQAEVEKLFIDFISSPQVKDVAQLISRRLNRPLEPFDIWYNGFKARGSYTEEQLNKIVKTKYPNVEAVQNDLGNILVKLGFDKAKAAYIASNVKVEASRGAGHAYGSAMKEDKVLLRSRMGKDGMDYKGYNIGIHEFGHNTEQVITLHDVDYYTLNRVPNTAFTEATAFMFQKRDLELLGLEDTDPLKEHMAALTNFWANYEIMGVSLVDMKVWEWMYANPLATPSQLKEAVIRIAKDVWTQYYAPVFGSADEPILAIYSHMISSPLYLSNYPLGHVIDFQLEQHIKGKNFATEVLRMYTQGSVLPQAWMKGAVGTELSVQPILDAVSKALEAVK